MKDSNVEEKTSMENLVEAQEPTISEVQQKFLFLGQTSEVDRITKYMKSQKDCTLIILSKEEMDSIVLHRVGQQRQDEVESFLDDEVHKKRAESLAIEFVGRFGRGKEGETGYLLKSSMKKATTMSWSKFEEVIGTLDMFGFIQWLQDGKRDILNVIVDPQKIIDNKKVEIQRTLDFAKGQLIELQNKAGDKIDKKKVEALKNSLTIKF